MNKKHHLRLRAGLYALLALFFLSMPLWAEIGEGGLGYPFVFALAALFGYLSFRQYKQIKSTKEEDRAYAPATNATAAQQIKFYKTYMALGLVAFPLLTLIVVSDLNDLESRSVESVSIWAPVAFLYGHFGYWPAVLSVPLLGIVVLFLFLRKIYLVRSTGKTAAS
jgi:hypothetical protein